MQLVIMYVTTEWNNQTKSNYKDNVCNITTEA